MIEKILCSAVYYNDKKIHPHQPINIETGFVITGRRHCNCYTTVTILKSVTEQWSTFKDRDSEGFITTLNRFVSRTTALEIAIKANQLLNPEIIRDKSIGLCSEDLW
jgi:hypothetical protein